MAKPRHGPFFPIMPIHFILKNYRCFSEQAPAKITLSNGTTALVGVNNAGKSTLLRFFYEFRPLFAIIATNVNAIMNLESGAGLGFQLPPEIADPEELFFNGNSEDMELTINLSDHGDIPHPDRVVTEAVFTLSRQDTMRRQGNNAKARFSKSGRNIRTGAAGSLAWMGSTLTDNSAVLADFQPLMDACKTISEACYIPAFRHASHFSPADGAPGNYYDMHVGRPFIDLWRGMQTGDVRANRERIHRLVEEVRTIFGFEELQINTSISGQALQLMIDGKPFNLQDLGAGLAQFILVLGTAAFRKSSYILIDETELSLHPSLQVTFVMKLAAYASQGLLFATHNIGLARSVAEEIYSVSAGTNGSEIRTIEKTPRLAELLGELNYEGYRPLGFNKVLLVEGRTSVKVFIELLRLFNKDHQFLVVPMSDLINRYSRDELQEVTRISPNTFAVIDSERQNAGGQIEAAHEAFAQHCRELQIDCLVLEHRAIENYLSDRAVKVVQGAAYRALEPFEGRQGLNLWPKTENWKIARAMKSDEILATDLGQFLQRI